MGLYIGGQKYKMTISGITHNMSVFSETPITNGIRLLSLDNYTLKDKNGLYLTTIKEDE